MESFQAGLKSFCHRRYSKHICQILHYVKKESNDTHKCLSKDVKFNGKTMFHCHIFQQLYPDKILAREVFRKKSKSSFYIFVMIAQKLVSLRKPVQFHIEDTTSILN